MFTHTIFWDMAIGKYVGIIPPSEVQEAKELKCQ